MTRQKRPAQHFGIKCDTVEIVAKASDAVLRKDLGVKCETSEIKVTTEDPWFVRGIGGPDGLKIRNRDTIEQLQAGKQAQAIRCREAILAEYNKNEGKVVPASPSLQDRINWRLGWNKTMGKPFIQLKAIHKHIDDLFAEKRLPASYKEQKKSRTI